MAGSAGGRGLGGGGTGARALCLCACVGLRLTSILCLSIADLLLASLAESLPICLLRVYPSIACPSLSLHCFSAALSPCEDKGSEAWWPPLSERTSVSEQDPLPGGLSAVSQDPSYWLLCTRATVLFEPSSQALPVPEYQYPQVSLDIAACVGCILPPPSDCVPPIGQEAPRGGNHGLLIQTEIP